MAANCPQCSLGRAPESQNKSPEGHTTPRMLICDPHAQPAITNTNQGTPAFAQHSCCNAGARPSLCATGALTPQKSRQHTGRSILVAQHTPCDGPQPCSAPSVAQSCNVHTARSTAGQRRGIWSPAQRSRAQHVLHRPQTCTSADWHVSPAHLAARARVQLTLLPAQRLRHRTKKCLPPTTDFYDDAEFSCRVSF